MASETYAQRILRERPTHTKGGTPVTISIGAKNRVYIHTPGSTYVAADAPVLFGWPRTGRRRTKAPLTLVHKGYTYVRTVKVKQ